MTPEQALILKTFDSATDDRARFMDHTAFEDPNTPENALKRQSIEIRTMALFWWRGHLVDFGRCLPEWWYVAWFGQVGDLVADKLLLNEASTEF